MVVNKFIKKYCLFLLALLFVSKGYSQCVTSNPECCNSVTVSVTASTFSYAAGSVTANITFQVKAPSPCFAGSMTSAQLYTDAFSYISMTQVSTNFNSSLYFTTYTVSRIFTVSNVCIPNNSDLNVCFNYIAEPTSITCSKALPFQIPAYTNTISINASMSNCNSGNLTMSGTAINGQWHFGDGQVYPDPPSGNPGNKTHVYSTPGIYTVSLTGTNILCPLTTTLQIVSPPTGDFTYSTSVSNTPCVNGNVTLSITSPNPGYTYSWFINGAPYTATVPTGVYSNGFYPNTNTVALMVNSGMCASTITKTITVPPYQFLLPSDFTYSLTTSCTPTVPSSIALGIINYSTGTTSYGWTINGTTVASTGAIITTTVGLHPGINTIALSTISGSCNVALTKTVLIGSPESYTIFATNTGCKTFSLHYEATAGIPALVNPQWAFGDGSLSGSINSTSASCVHTYPGSGTYVLSLSGVGIDPCQTQTVVNVSDFMTPDFSYSIANLCDVTQGIYLNIPNYNGSYTYQWQFNNFTVPSLGATGLYGLVYSVNLQNGVNVIKLTVTNASGCSTTVTKVVNIGAPSSGFNVVPDYCLGEQLSVYNLSPGGSSYNWTVTPTVGSSSTLTSMNPVYTFTSAGLHQVKLSITTTLTSAGVTSVCTNSSSTSVNVYLTPNANFTTSGVSCNNTVSVTPASTMAVSVYTIDYGDGFSVSVNNSSIAPAYLSHTYAPIPSYTIYPITITFANGPCLSQYSQNVIINNTSSLVVTAPTQYICRHGGVPVTALVNSNVSGIGPFLYNWTGPNGFTSTLSVISATAGGAYNVTVTSTGACSITLTGNKIMEDLADPGATVLNIQHIDCLNASGTVSLNISAALSASGYIVNGYGVPATGSYAQTQFWVYNLIAGTNYITVANLLSPSCLASVPVLVTHSNEPVVSVNVTQPNSCPGTGIANASATHNTGNFYWYHLEDYPTIPCGSGSGLSLPPGSYVVKHVYNNCVATANFNVVSPVLNVSHVSGAGACPGNTIEVTLDSYFTLSEISTTTAYTVTAVPSGTVVSGSAPYHLYAGNYHVQAKASNGCTASHDFVISEIDPMKVSIQVNGPDCINNVALTAGASGGDGNYTYTWYKNSVTQTVTTSAISYTGITAPIAMSVTVLDGSGCVANASLTVTDYTPVSLKDCGNNYTENSTSISQCDIQTCLKGGQGDYNYKWFKLEAPEQTVEWKFYYNNHNEFVAKAGDDGPEILVPPPTTTVLMSGATIIDLSANNDHSLTTVAYPFWHNSDPEMNPAGQLLAIPNSTNPAHFYTVFEAAVIPTVEVFVSSYSGISGASGSIENFTSGDYNLHVTNAKGCKSSFSFPGLEFVDNTNFSMLVSFVWGMTLKTPTVTPTDPILHEDMIEAANELLDQQSACLAKQVKQLKSDMNVCSDLANVKDELNLEYILNESHHTLYYYDRAGRLTKTVPPQGVEYLDRAEIDAVKAFRKSGSGSEPVITPHRIATTYNYNSFGQLLSQTTPDGGATNFIYDSKNRLRFSQNAYQKKISVNKYSYTRYDALGRIIEVGQTGQLNSGQNTLNFSNPAASANIQLADIDNFPNSQTEQVTKTVYSEPAAITYYGKPQRYTQNRVSYTYLDNDLTVNGDEHYTYYSYDSHGNVEWLAQDDPDGIGKNYIAYEYDLVSGKVLKVSYNEKRPDRFYHRYIYDSENRLKRTETSRNGEIWDADATYAYYPHGPLKRNVIGEDRVQGLDYIYTLNGWIKSINAPRLTSGDDPGKDNAHTGLALERTAADRFGMVLNYFNEDYKSNSTNFLTDAGNNYRMSGLNGNTDAAPSLYNGNISSWVQSQLDISGTSAIDARADLFKYDILNRITNSSSMAEAGQSAGWANMPGGANTYKTNYSYDANGNILTLKRYDNNNGLMDDLKYTYDAGEGLGAVNTNTLASVRDATTGIVTGRNDLIATHGYSYDEIGNLVSETGEEMRTINGSTDPYVTTMNVKWTVYGKIKSINKSATDGLSEYKEKIEFDYDAAGNRVKKYYWLDDPGTANGQVDHKEEITTWYVRDAQGNPMATYKRYYDDHVTPHLYKIDLIEQPIYGSERIGQNVQPVTLASSTSYEGLGLPSNGFGEISEYQNWITTTSKTQLLPGGAAGTDNLCQCRVVSLNGSNYNVASDAVQLLGLASNGVAVAEDLNRNLQFFVVLAKKYLGAQDACLVFDKDGHLMKGTELITSVDPNSKPIIVNIPGSKQYAVVTLNATQQPVYHIIDMDLLGYSPLTNNKSGQVVSANNALNAANPVASKHGLHFTGTEDHITGHAMVYANRFVPNANIPGQGTTDIMAYDFGTGTVSPTAYVLHSVTGCANTETGQMQISPDGSKLSWWRNTRQLAGFTAKQGEILTMPLNTSRNALSGAVNVKPIRPAGNFGNGMFEIMNNSSDVLFSQRGVYKDNSSQIATDKFDRNVWKYTPVNLSSLNPNTNNPVISYLFGEIKRGVDGNYYIPQMGASRDQIHSYSGSIFNGNVNAGDTAYKLASSLPTQVYKIFADPTQNITEFARNVGDKNYELKDHLGNVRVVISDAKLIESVGVNSDVVDASDDFMPEVKNYTDYYAFGMEMPGRKFNPGKYRYGFNGKENDNEVKGTGNSLDFGARMYDSRIGRWLSTDPLAKEYTFSSPYTFALNTPLQAYDPDGRLVIFVNGFRQKAYKSYVLRGGNLFNTKPWNKTPEYDNEYSWGYQGKSYWSGYGKNVDGAFMDRFNDHHAIYVDGMYKPQSKAQQRYDRGVADGIMIIEKIKAGEIELEAGETIKLVGHSHGGWHSTGMADAIAKAGYNVEALYAINPHQPNQKVIRLDGVPDYYSAQYSRKTDHVSSDQSKLPKVAGLPVGDAVTGDSKYGEMNGYDATVELNNMPNAELGGHNVEDGVDEIMSIGEGCIGEVCAEPSQSKPK